jgi:hypothetical protein
MLPVYYTAVKLQEKYFSICLVVQTGVESETSLPNIKVMEVYVLGKEIGLCKAIRGGQANLVVQVESSDSIN